jgi:dolichyl-phosphate beta-glucosyltransferase
MTVSTPSSATYSAYETWKTKPLSETPQLSIIIPAYNESERIIPTIGAIAYTVSNLLIPWELIISDDGSKDDTAQQVEKLGLANLRLLRAPQNGGKGNAVRSGMMAARGQIAVFVDADNSSPIEELPKLLSAIRGGADAAIGSRGLADSKVVGKSGLRTIMSAVLNKLVKSGLGLPFADTQCGFKAFTAPAVKKLFGKQTITGFSFDLEILYLARYYGLRVTEVPIEWHDAPGTKVSSLKHSIQFLKDMVRIRRQSWAGVYKVSEAAPVSASRS